MACFKWKIIRLVKRAEAVICSSSPFPNSAPVSDFPLTIAVERCSEMQKLIWRRNDYSLIVNAKRAVRNQLSIRS